MPDTGNKVQELDRTWENVVLVRRLFEVPYIRETLEDKLRTEFGFRALIDAWSRGNAFFLGAHAKEPTAGLSVFCGSFWLESEGDDNAEFRSHVSLLRFAWKQARELGALAAAEAKRVIPELKRLTAVIPADNLHARRYAYALGFRRNGESDEPYWRFGRNLRCIRYVMENTPDGEVSPG